MMQETDVSERSPSSFNHHSTRACLLMKAANALPSSPR